MFVYGLWPVKNSVASVDGEDMGRLVVTVTVAPSTVMLCFLSATGGYPWFLLQLNLSKCLVMVEMRLVVWSPSVSRCHFELLWVHMADLHSSNHLQSIWTSLQLLVQSCLRRERFLRASPSSPIFTKLSCKWCKWIFWSWEWGGMIGQWSWCVHPLCSFQDRLRFAEKRHCKLQL